MNEKQRDVALFRYSLIREAADESLTNRERASWSASSPPGITSGPAGGGCGWPVTRSTVGSGLIASAGSKRWLRCHALASR